MPQGQTRPMLVEHTVSLLQPCRVVPQLGRVVGFVPGTIRGHDGLHLQSCESVRFKYLADGPHMVGDVVVGQIGYILRAVHVIEGVGASGPIRVVDIRIEELRCGLTGFHFGGVGIARNEN